MPKSERLIRRALAIDEKSYGPRHPRVALRLNNLAQLLHLTNRAAEAEPLYRRAILYWRSRSALVTLMSQPASTTWQSFFAKQTGRWRPNRFTGGHLQSMKQASVRNHPNVSRDLNNLALLYDNLGRLDEAEALYRRALAIAEKSLGPDHPDIANRLINLGSLLRDMNRRSEAEPLLRRALKIDEKSFGPVHPNVARDLDSLAGLLEADGFVEAELLYGRAIAIEEASFGPDHPNVAKEANNMAVLPGHANRPAEAEPFFRRRA